MSSAVHLIPNVISEDSLDSTIPSSLRTLVSTIDHYVVENEKVARRYLKKLRPEIVIDELQFYSMGKHAEADSMSRALTALKNGNHVGVISDAGCPGVADPGSEFVRLAHETGHRVTPYVGPSSILLTLMASGMNGQQFCFHGYVPKDRRERLDMIKGLIRSIRQNRSTQLFMDTPFRNDSLLEDLISSVPDDIRICIAKDITGQSEFIRSEKASYWKKNKPELRKIPVLFALGH